MKILLISESIPFPAKDGKGLPIAMHFSKLSQNNFVDFLLLHEDPDYFELNREKIPPTFKNVMFVQKERASFGKIVFDELMKRSFRSMNYTYSACELSELENQTMYDVVWLGSFNVFSFMEYCINTNLLKYRKIGMSLHDVKTYSYRNSIVKFVKGGFLEIDMLLRYLRSFNLESIERKILKRCDLIHLMSMAEKLKIEELFKSDEFEIEPATFVLPNGYNNRLKKLEYLGENSNNILFMTHLSGGRRMESSWFLRKIWPLIRKGSNMNLVFVGTPPSKESSLYKDNRIRILGFVDDLALVFQSSCMSILPIFHNCGHINRLHDGLSMGMPMVITSFVASTCSGLTDGIHAAISDNPVEFAQTVIDLRHDKDQRRRLSKGAMEFSKLSPSWSELTQRLENKLIKLISN